ncbi:PREDICTED: putative tripartite motif-containing protein 75-like [Chrysochloris asiatica]|uniref:Tripartite motif-containing protein 75-like n=1 Tax=Chrysochloris asiatica TaxID=185453 RepID=A0A9B0WPY6_CHRAS|nr:PREDICTED: putative tripartite motif-containing protein 75-like [Chrysochloris asiatica]
MATAESLEGLLADTKCPICLDCLRNPVTIECGHNFCHSCIEHTWKDQHDIFLCPVCRHSCQDMQLRNNTQLGNMAEIAKLLHITMSKMEKEEETSLCKSHNQLLSLFCEEDQKFLEYERETLLTRLAEEEKYIKQKLNANIAAFSDYKSTLKSLLKDVAEKSVVSEVQLLSNIKSIHDRYERLKSPDLFSFQLRKEECVLPPLSLELQKIIKKFKREVTLDPETAHPNLLVSEDKKSVTLVLTKKRSYFNQRGFTTYSVVLGCEDFQSGRHYWEVKVDDKPEWMLGVCVDSLSRKETQLPTGQNRCWAIQLCNGDYVAQGPVPLILVLRDKPRGIGVYLDYELGMISFYNLNNRSHIHSFTDRFSGVLKPYFYVGHDSKPLTICAVTDYEL